MPSPHPQSASACGMAGFPVLARLVSAGFGLAVLALILTLAVGFGLVQLPPGPGVGEALLVGAQVVCSAAILWVFLGLRRGIRRGQQIDVQLRHLSEALREQAERARAADRLKSSFLAQMSHELRTPLNSILGFTGVLLQGLPGPLNPEQRKQLELVRSSARHLLSLINDLLDLAKIEAGELRLACHSYDLRTLLDRVLATVRLQAEAKGLPMRASIDPAVGLATGDARRMEQVLLNLLSNAIQFTERGEVELSVSLSDGGRRVRFQVRDTGIGIRAEDQHFLFRPFQQLETERLRLQEGTGLGLAICKHLTGLMGGEIQVASQPNLGSTFTLELPLHCESFRRAAALASGATPDI